MQDGEASTHVCRQCESPVEHQSKYQELEHYKDGPPEDLICQKEKGKDPMSGVLFAGGAVMRTLRAVL